MGDDVCQVETVVSHQIVFLSIRANGSLTNLPPTIPFSENESLNEGGRSKIWGFVFNWIE